MTRGMKGQSKKIFSVVGAFVLGIAIIFITWKGGSLSNISSFKKEPVVSKTDLTVIPGNSKVEPSLNFWSSNNVTGNSAGTQVLSTSTTDILAYNLITNYANAQRNEGTTTLSDLQISAQAEALAQKVQLPSGPQYTSKNLIVSQDNSLAARTAYSQQTNALLNAFSTSQVNEDLDIIFANEATKSDAVKQAELAQNISHYEKLIRGLLAIKVPSGVTTFHLGLVQIFSDMEHSLSLMADIFNDPVKGLAAFTQYRTDIENLTKLTEDYQVTPPQKS